MENDYIDYDDNYSSEEEIEDKEEDVYSLVEFIRENLKAVFKFSDDNGYPFFEKSRLLAEFDFIDTLFN